MTFQKTELIELGHLLVTDNKAMVMTVGNIGTSLVLVVHDSERKVGGLAHIILPESALGDGRPSGLAAKYADEAIPAMMDEFLALGGQPAACSVSLVGGAQLFNFGGGSGNMLNIGARNVTAIQTAITKYNLTAEKLDIGGNKARSVRYLVATGQVFVKRLGSDEFLL
ncbi:MAG: chemotaxis protein CheD [Candidatus Melainabacteria bacterium]